MEQLEQSGTDQVIFSYEESYGYMIGHYVRDNPTVRVCAACRDGSMVRSSNMTLYDALYHLFENTDGMGKKPITFMHGVDGAQRISELVASLRRDPPAQIAGNKVVRRCDYRSGTETNVLTGESTPITPKGSNVLRFFIGRRVLHTGSSLWDRTKSEILYIRKRSLGADERSQSTPGGRTGFGWTLMIPALSHFLQAMVFTVRNARSPSLVAKNNQCYQIATKNRPQSLGAQGVQIWKYWDGYPNATQRHFRHEKRRFFMLFTRFSQEFLRAKGVTQRNGRKALKLWIWEDIPKNGPI